MSQATELIARQLAAGSANARVWADILYNVKTYGAAGNGTTDDTAAVQATIDYAISVGGKAIFFPHGSYKVTVLTNLSSVVLFGDNASFVGISTTINQIGSVTSNLVFNVKDSAYGAKGDGVTNDTTAIQNAITAAAVNGGIVFFPPGTYKISTALTVPSNVTLWFANGAKLSIDSGITVTINGPICAGLYQIFSGLGLIAGKPMVDRFFPQWWGAKGDGINDDTLTIQSAITTCGTAGGGTVDLPIGIYKVSNTINVTYNNVVIEGHGKASQILTTNATSDIFTVGDGVNPSLNNNFKNFSVDSTVVKTAGWAFNMRMAARSKIKEVWIVPPENISNPIKINNGIYFDRFDYCVVDNCNITVSNVGIQARGNADQSFGVALWITGGTKIQSNASVSGSQTSTGVNIGGSCGGVYFGDVDIIEIGIGVDINNVLSGVNNREIFMGSTCALDSTGASVIRVKTNSVIHLDITGSWIASAGMNNPDAFGILVDNPQAPDSLIKMTGVRFYNNRGGGFAANGGSFVMSGCVFKQNGLGANGGHGIWVINASVTDFSITGCWVEQSGKAAKGTGILIAAGNNYMITGNIVRGNLQAQITDTGGANKVVANNLTT